jgi:integrase
MPKLMKKLVDAVDPAEADTFLWDAEVKGFGLEVSPAGRKSYVLQYRTAAGRSRRYSIGLHGSPWTCEEARGRAVHLLREIAHGNDPLDGKAEARAALTVNELADLYLADGPADKPNKKSGSWATDRSNINRHIRPLLGRKIAKALQQSDIARFQADVAAGKSAADMKTKLRGRAIVTGGKGTAARSVAVLGAMLQFGIGRGLLTDNPAKGVKLFRGEKKERFLSHAEVVALADALTDMQDGNRLHERMADAIRLLMLTGARKNEILKLQWSEVDIERGCLRLADSKTGAKTIVLAAAARQVLAGLASDSEFVLPAIRGKGHLVGLQKAWEAVRVRATELARQRAREAGESLARAPDLSNVRLHDLRHSFASFAVADGATLYMVGKVLGHKQSRTTEIYAHLHDDPLRAVAERTAAKIADAFKIGAERERSVARGEVVPLRPRRRAKA